MYFHLYFFFLLLSNSVRVNRKKINYINIHNHTHRIVIRSNPVNADVLQLTNRRSLESSNFNKSNAIVVYLHGFSEHVPGGPGQSSQEVRDGEHFF